MKQLQYFLKLRGNPRKSREQINQIQHRGLQHIVCSAYKNTKYYKNLFDHHQIKPADITASTITKLPLLTKKILRSAEKDLLSKIYGEKDWVVEGTGGSTGKPVTIYSTPDSMACAQAAKLRTYREHGYKFSQKICTFLFDIPKKKFFHKFGIHRTFSITPFMPTKEAITYLQRHKPDVFDGFPSKIAEVARYVKKYNVQGIKPTLSFAAGETIQEKDQEIIKEQFSNPINVYMSREFKVIAWECERRDGLHINEDLLLIEIVDPETKEPILDERPGEIVITGFSNDAMPLLRYETEDVGVLTRKPCSCGRTFIRLKYILGRINDFVVLPSGERILGQSYILSVLRGLDLSSKVEQWQARQKKDGSIDLALDAHDLSQKDKHAMLKEFEKTLGQMKIRFQPASEIIKTKQGKYRTFSSDLT